MGVSGSGKTTVGSALADALGMRFVDADDLHPDSNVAKMAANIPLTDDDRWPWLNAVGEHLQAARATGLVMACSALRRAYRDRIRSVAPDVVFVHLDGTRELLAARIAARTDHFMPSTLLESQLATLEPLEPDEAGLVMDVGMPVADLVDGVATRLREGQSLR